MVKRKRLTENSYSYIVDSQEKMSMQLLNKQLPRLLPKRIARYTNWKELCQVSKGVCKLKYFPVPYTFEIILLSYYNFVL